MKKGAGWAVGLRWGTVLRGVRSVRGRRARPSRGCVLFLAVVLLPEVAWGQPVNERIDHMLWEDVGGCGGAERYLEKLPKGLHAEEARECLEAEKEEKEEMRRRMKGYEEGAYKALERGNVARARQRLEELRKLDEMAPEVMDLEDAIAEAEEKLGTMREYAETGHEALGRGDLEKARRFLERLKDAKSPLAVELEDAVAEAEAKRRKQEAEARRRAEAERKRKAEAEEAARRARAEAERKRKEREAEERRKRARKPGDTFEDCPECPEMVVVPPGGPAGRSFAVGVYEVTFAEWDACVSDGGCGGYRPDDEGWGRGKRPVVNVSWDDAQAYVRWLSGETGEDYRLLSEAEWEYVARAGTTTRYWWRDEVGWNRANCRGCGSRWDGEGTAPVGSFSANPFGLHDVHGNVLEWVEDCWEEGNCGRRVLRGGSWVDFPWNLRSASRDGYISGNRSYVSGFRVARTLTP